MAQYGFVAGYFTVVGTFLAPNECCRQTKSLRSAAHNKRILISIIKSSTSIMVKTVQQEAFVFSHKINSRLPHASERLMQLMILDAQQLSEPATLAEVVSLLRTEVDLLHTFGDLFLPPNLSLEVWTSSNDEEYCMLVNDNVLRKLCPMAEQPEGTEEPMRQQVTPDDVDDERKMAARSSPRGIRTAHMSVGGKSPTRRRPIPFARGGSPGSTGATANPRKRASEASPARQGAAKKSRPEPVSSTPVSTRGRRGNAAKAAARASARAAVEEAEAEKAEKQEKKKFYYALEYLNYLTMWELKDLLGTMKLASSGSKAKLISRLAKELKITGSTLMKNLPDSVRVYEKGSCKPGGSK